MKHYKYGGSTAKRTLQCPAWVRLADAAPKLERTNAAAERGTAMHEIMERALIAGVAPIDLVTPEHGFVDFDLEHLNAAHKAVDTLFKTYGVTDYVVEPLMEMNPEVGGSTDLIAAGPEHVIVIDYKFGRGAVSVENNAQLAFYHFMASFSDETKDLVQGRKFIGAIIQPAVRYEPFTYEYSQEEITQFRRDLVAAIERSKDAKMEPSAGDHCQYCPALPYCPTKRIQIAAALRMSPKQAATLAEAMDLVAPLQAFISAVESEVLTALTTGCEVPGYKLVSKRVLRKWADANEALNALYAAGLDASDALHPAEIKTPAQIEKILKKAKIELDVAPFLDTSEPGVTIAPENDPRTKLVMKGN